MHLDGSQQRPWTGGGQRLYFAYGLNMHRAEMAERCPNAVLQGIARLDRHEFLINARGVATVVPARSFVYGVLWTVSASDETRLDRFEGVEFGFYRKRGVTVRSEAGQVQAFAYVAWNSVPGRPRAGYLESILEAA